MSLSHMIYIPFLLAIGFAGGWYLGTSSVRSEWARDEKRRRDREEGKSES